MPLLTAVPLTGEPWKVEVAEPRRDWMDKVPDGHIYRCLPLVAACGMGWVIRCPCDFTVVWNGQWGRVPDLLFDWGPWTPETLMASRQIGSHFGSGIITFRVPFLFRTSEPGIGLRVSGAPNFYRFNCTALEGWVETWWLPFPFTMNWKVDAPYVPVQFKAGDPLVFIQPYRISDLEEMEPQYGRLEDQPKAFQEAHREWTRSRNSFNQSIVQGGEKGWQKHYQKGIDHNGGVAPEHRRAVPDVREFKGLQDLRPTVGPTDGMRDEKSPPLQ